MSPVKQQYRDISPVTLQVAGGAVTSSLYCGEVEGLSGGLIESFMVEFYRCKLCQFTCGLKAAISNHLLFRHRPPTLTYLEGGDGEHEADDGEEDRFDLNGESKQSDEDEDFLLYNMLDDMSPSTCDISSEGGLQVAHTCEVSTLFEEASVDLSCPIDPPATQEEMAQSAHLMTLGLCRISAPKPPPLPPSTRPFAPPPDLKPSESGSHQTTTPSSGEQRLACLLCAAILPSSRLLDVHVRSHRAAGGFGCICCSLTADSWEELEPHWRSHCRRRRKRRRKEEQKSPCRRRKEEQETQEPPCRRRRKEEQEKKEPSCRKKRRRKEEQGKKRKKLTRPFSCPVCRKTFRSIASRDAHQQKVDGCDQRRHGNRSEGWRSRLIGRAGGTEAETTDSGGRTDSLKSVTEEKTEEKDGFLCSLCHKKFSTKLTLRRHMGTHGGDKPFTCPQCPYSSRLKASLLQHLRTHTGEKPYRCAECPYAFIDRSSLLRHSRTHSQEKPYSCQHCDYSSIQKKSLDLHARRHHTGEVFPCQQCQYSSPDRQLLLRHIRRRHGSDQSP